MILMNDDNSINSWRKSPDLDDTFNRDDLSYLKRIGSNSPKKKKLPSLHKPVILLKRFQSKYSLHQSQNISSQTDNDLQPKTALNFQGFKSNFQADLRLDRSEGLSEKQLLSQLTLAIKSPKPVEEVKPLPPEKPLHKNQTVHRLMQPKDKLLPPLKVKQSPKPYLQYYQRKQPNKIYHHSSKSTKSLSVIDVNRQTQNIRGINQHTNNMRHFMSQVLQLHAEFNELIQQSDVKKGKKYIF